MELYHGFKTKAAHLICSKTITIVNISSWLELETGTHMSSHHVLSVTLVPRTDRSDYILGAIHAGDECSQCKLRTEDEQSTAGDETTETVSVRAPCK